jgi:hypothetical protein
MKNEHSRLALIGSAILIGLAASVSAEAQDNDHDRTDGPLVLKEQGGSTSRAAS